MTETKSDDMSEAQPEAEDNKTAPASEGDAPAKKASKKRVRKKGMTANRPTPNYKPEEDPDLWEDPDEEVDPWQTAERKNPCPRRGRPMLVVVRVHSETGEVEWPENVQRWLAQAEEEEESK